jgi:hypothetical protein
MSHLWDIWGQRGAKAKRLCVPGMGHMGHELDGIQWGHISPVDIGHEMDPMLAKRDMQRAHKGLKRLTTTRKKTGNKENMIQASMQTGHKLDKQDMVPDAREIMRTWCGTYRT